MPASVLKAALSAASCMSRSSVVRTSSPPPNARPAPYLSTSCWRSHSVKYGRERVGRGALDVGGRGQRDLGAVGVLRLVDVALLEHLLKDEVAARERVLRVRAGREGRRRGDDPGEHRRLVRQQLGGAGVGALGQALRVVLAEVGARGGLDPVGALAEVDGVQVLGQDLVLVPLALEVVGERRLAQLLEHGPRVLRLERVLDELLGDGRGALDRAAGKQVLDHRAADPPEVHALVLVEALVLDRDHGLLHVGVDVLGLDQDPAGVGEQGAHLAALGVEDLGVLRLRVLLLALELGQVAGDGHHHPEDRRDHPQRREADEDDREAQLLDAAGLGLARAARADALRKGGGAARRARAVAVPRSRRARHPPSPARGASRGRGLVSSPSLRRPPRRRSRPSSSRPRSP